VLKLESVVFKDLEVTRGDIESHGMSSINGIEGSTPGSPSHILQMNGLNFLGSVGCPPFDLVTGDRIPAFIDWL